MSQSDQNSGVPAPRLLRKGLEEEVYTGTADASVVGLSHRVAADLAGFSTEPDSRNVEFTTAPYRSYRTLIDRLMSKRCSLRRYLKRIGDYTLIPGSTLSLDPRNDFRISNSENPYYQYIRDTYGTDVVTASTHINVGIEDLETLIRACRVIRCEASLYLAMTASSPFLDGETTGSQSTRWTLFPATPKIVPFHRDHAEFISWMEEQLKLETMNNSRHLWVSVRPNGADTPYDLNRLELRICDRISEPALIGAVVGLLEARVWQILEDPELDPLLGLADRNSSTEKAYRERNDQLVDWCTANEQAVAKEGFEAKVVRWDTGETITAGEWLAEMYERTRPTAEDHGFAEQLEHIPSLLKTGNLAQRWIAAFDSGLSAREVLQQAMAEHAEEDNAYNPECPKIAP